VQKRNNGGKYIRKAGGMPYGEGLLGRMVMVDGPTEWPFVRSVRQKGVTSARHCNARGARWSKERKELTR
jgi:hypothetical protein